MSTVGFGQFRVVFDSYNVSCTANTNFLTAALLKTPASSNVFATNTPISLFILYASFQAQGNLSIIRTETDGTVLHIEQLNSSSINANTLFTSVFPVSPKEQVNFQYSVTTTANKITILELMER